MNITNVAALAVQLESLGFNGLRYDLLRKICFMPHSFFLSFTSESENDKVNFEISFEMASSDELYKLMYYDAILAAEKNFQKNEINGIQLAELEKSFEKIDWAALFNPSTFKDWKADDKNSWDTEQRVATLIEQVRELEKTPEGKAYANDIRSRFWGAIAYYNLYCPFKVIKDKQGFVQRFYFFENQPSITVNECIRFLRHQKLVKEFNIKTKASFSSDKSSKDQKQTSESKGKRNYAKANRKGKAIE
ncbi:hypothetical protein [Ferruginibacter sp.]